MLNCKQITQLISDGLDRKLSLWQRMNLRLHLMMCGACSAYSRQVTTLHRVIHWWFDESSVDATASNTPACPEQTKQRITQSLRDQVN